MRAVPSSGCVAIALVLAGCGGAAAIHPTTSSSRHRVRPRGEHAASVVRVASVKTAQRRDAEALVAAETVNRLISVDLDRGRVVGSVRLPADPENVAASPGAAVVASARTGTVSVLEPLGHVRRVITGFGSPHIVAISPDGQHAFVTDDERGTVSVVSLVTARLVARVSVGAGAHHMAFSPDQHRLWVALGEDAHTIKILDTSDPTAPRVIGRFDPGFAVHDIQFSPDGRRVWVTSATGTTVVVIDARTLRVVFRVAAGRGPQHLAFEGPYAYITSGYSSSLERVAASDGRLLDRVRSPYGSFELDARYGFVVTSSLMTGEVAIYTTALRRLRVVRVAPVARDVSLTLRPSG